MYVSTITKTSPMHAGTSPNSFVGESTQSTPSLTILSEPDNKAVSIAPLIMGAMIAGLVLLVIALVGIITVLLRRKTKQKRRNITGKLGTLN